MTDTILYTTTTRRLVVTANKIGFDIYVTKIMAVGRWGRSQLCKISLQRAKLVAVRHT